VYLVGFPHTCKIASLCISWSVQAGIMHFKVANSSFIFDLLLLSMTLCAVFLAIFLPATLVKLGCFLFVVLELDAAFLFKPFGPDCNVILAVSSVSCGFGFICMMVRDRVGGGGNVKFGLEAEWICLSGAELPWSRFGAIAGGGRLKHFSVADMGERSLPSISVEAAGVGGRLGRGIVMFADLITAGRVSRVSVFQRNAGWRIGC